MPRTAGGGPHIVWLLIMSFASLWWCFFNDRNNSRKSENGVRDQSCFHCLFSEVSSPGLKSAIFWAFSVRCWLAVGSAHHLEQNSASQWIRSRSWIQPSWTYNLSAVIHCEQGDRVPKISMAGWLAHVSHILGAHVWPCVTLIHSDLVLR